MSDLSSAAHLNAFFFKKLDFCFFKRDKFHGIFCFLLMSFREMSKISSIEMCPEDSRC